MSAKSISHDTFVGGIALFLGPPEDGDKIAVMTTEHHQGVFKGGVAQYEKMDPSHWTIHWCNPMMHVSLVQAVAEYLKTL